MSAGDGFAAEMCALVARRLSETGMPGDELRERRHLDPLLKDEIERKTGVRPTSTRIATPWFTAGGVDVVVERPRVLMELKWSYYTPGKIFESTWDAIKLALIGLERDCDGLYVVTGAENEEWRQSETRDLFETGTVDPLDLWKRRLIARGPNGGLTAGEDLVVGGRGNQPTSAPERLAIRLLDTFQVGPSYALKLISVESAGRLRPWPQIPYEPRKAN